MEQFRLLATDGGPHPSDKWAMHTAEEIFDLSNLDKERTLPARLVQLKIAQALQPHYEAVQSAENDQLPGSLDAPYDATPHLDAMTAAAVAPTAGTPWQAHYERADVLDGVRRTIGHHVVTAQHVERLWHCDRNPSDAATAFKARWQGV